MDVGTLEEIDVFPRIVEWTIPEFFQLPKQIGYVVYSEEFRYYHCRCAFEAYPNGTERLPGIMVIKLLVDCFVRDIKRDGIKQWELEARRANGTVLRKSGGWKEDGGCEVEMNLFIPYEEIEEGCHPSGCFKLRCTLHCDLSFYYEKYVSIGSQTEGTSRTDKLSCDLEELFIRGDYSDVTIRVEKEEFKVHKIILGARTPVFLSMFQHKMSEKINGVVDIDDCDAITFREFLRYLYSGRVSEFSPNTVFSLHKVADKYQVNELKAYCVEFLKNNLSVDTFCDAIVLSTQHDEEGLTNKVMKFLSKNMEKIKLTESWKVFSSENPLESEKLLVEALKIKETAQSSSSEDD